MVWSAVVCDELLIRVRPLRLYLPRTVSTGHGDWSALPVR